MANKKQIMDKIARNLDMMKISYTRDVASILVENGSNDLTISYVDADIQKPMGGVDGAVSPFLGMGVANPGILKLQGASANSASALTVGDLLNTDIAARVFHVMSGFVNNINLAKTNTGAGASLDVTVEGHPDLIAVGQ